MRKIHVGLFKSARCHTVEEEVPVPCTEEEAGTGLTPVELPNIQAPVTGWPRLLLVTARFSLLRSSRAYFILLISVHFSIGRQSSRSETK